MKEILKRMLKELDDRTKQTVIDSSINHKLDRSLGFYMDDLKKTCDYILSRNAMSMLKAIDKEILSEANEENL